MGRPPKVKIGITPQQTVVLGHLLEGLQTKIIAYKMGIAEATVKTHIRALHAFYDVNNTGELVTTIYKRKLRVAQKALWAIDPASVYAEDRVFEITRTALKEMQETI